jgi:hypothetical protein
MIKMHQVAESLGQGDHKPVLSVEDYADMEELAYEAAIIQPC